MNDTRDRDALRYTLDWVSSNHYPLSGSDVLIALLPITRQISDLSQREQALHDAARRISIGSPVLV
ncbi:hypothetical protein [Nocardia sp. 348MFTsu5.1]|jgi:hypothetical protein|uniref:hypothetical protein n=1 Tax=Nocardia sp. 348MFTsu5.1 TaxID=1172185 RepID=UPI000362AE5A|nr:hypothetical protein [Nocardia sp. 348MFTsu5.1]